MANAWLAHVKATMKKNKGKPFKQVLQLAKKNYKKKGSTTKKAKKTGKRKRTAKATKRRKRHKR